MKSAMGSNSEVQNSDCHVRIGSDSVAKLGKRRLTRNNRIGAKDLLNRCCALVAALESMLPARAPKIVLQQNLPTADSCTAATRYSIGSSSQTKITGIVVVAFLAARADTVPPPVAITA